MYESTTNPHVISRVVLDYQHILFTAVLTRDQDAMALVLMLSVEAKVPPALTRKWYMCMSLRDRPPSPSYPCPALLGYLLASRAPCAMELAGLV